MMPYRECIEILNYALKILRYDSRQSVRIEKMNELMGCIKSAEAMCTEAQIFDIQVKATFSDLMAAVVAVKSQSTGMMMLTDVMKQTLVSGVVQIKEHVCIKAYGYYEEHDFEDTPENVPIFRDIVMTYAEAGGRL